MKRTVRAGLRRLMQSHDGLSGVGRFADRLARHVVFQARDIRSSARHKIGTDHRAVWPVDPVGRWLIDVGANVGDTIPYYLGRGFRVIAIEANPDLAQTIERKFAAAIRDKLVVVMNTCVVAHEGPVAELNIHTTNNQLSTAVPVGGPGAREYTRVQVPALRMKELARYNPLAVKIDVEHLDSAILKDMFDASFMPPYLSVEAHNPDVLCRLVAADYAEFKIVEGRYVASPLYAQVIDRNGKAEKYQFEAHDAGPIGEDVPGPWLTLAQTFEYFCEHGFGWKDLHARHPQVSAHCVSP
jgi:FkbM family methyltransferase